ncbi:MAG: MarR family transcriptional regulator [Saccharofermentanales bacterium]
MEKKDTLDMIMRLARVSRRRRPYDPGGRQLSRSVFRTMYILRESGPMRASQLAEGLDIRPASLTGQLRKMEDQGLIRKDRDPVDRRAYLVTLTPQGESELDRSRQERQARSKRLEEALTSEEAKQFALLADKLIAFFEAEESL